MRRLTKSQLRLECWRLRFVALAVTLVASSAAWLGTQPVKAPTVAALIRAGKLPAQLENVPSHNRRYRASLIPVANASWELRVAKSDGAPVSSATLILQSWMPEAPSVSGHRPEVVAEHNGDYRVDGLRLDRSGWWNVRLSVTDSGVTDSLAFNVIIP